MKGARSCSPDGPHPVRAVDPWASPQTRVGAAAPGIEVRRLDLVIWRIERARERGWLATSVTRLLVLPTTGPLDAASRHKLARLPMCLSVNIHGPRDDPMPGPTPIRESHARIRVEDEAEALPNRLRPLSVDWQPQGQCLRPTEADGATIETALPARTIEIRRWLRDPVGAVPGVLFVSDARHPGTRHSTLAGSSSPGGR